MAAAPQRGTFTFVGASGETYQVDAYISDVLAAPINLDGGVGAGTTSPLYWTCPEACTLVDWAVVTGLTDTTNIALVSNGAQLPNKRLRHAVFLTSLNNRPALRIPFKQGSMFGAIQA